MSRISSLLILLSTISLGYAQEEVVKLPTGWKYRQIPGTNVVIPLSGELAKDKATETSQKFKLTIGGLEVQVEVSQPDPKTAISKPVVEIMGQSLVASFQSAEGKQVKVIEAKQLEVNKAPAYRVVMDITEGDVTRRLRLMIVADGSRLVMLTLVGNAPNAEADSVRVAEGLRIVEPHSLNQELNR